MKIINNKNEIVGKDGKIIILPDNQKIALCTVVNNFDKEVIYATFVNEIDGIYYIFDSEENIKELDGIILNYLSNNLIAKEVSADDLIIKAYKDEEKNSEEIVEAIFNDMAEDDYRAIESPKVFALLELGDEREIDLKVFKYESEEDVNLAFAGENNKDYKLFRKVKLCKVVNAESLQYSSLKYFLELISSMKNPLEVEINSYLDRPPFSAKLFKVPVKYILINFRMQYILPSNKERMYSNCLADCLITYDENVGYSVHIDDNKSTFSDFNEYVNFDPNMSNEEYFYNIKTKEDFN